MKIKKAWVNRRKKSVEIETAKGILGLPFARLRLKPKPNDRVVEVIVDKELGKRAITYRLESGREDSIHLDAFLDFNQDPDFLRDVTLHKLTVQARQFMKKVGISKQEMIRRLKTSPSQLYRLLDPSNYRKSVDEMLRLLSVLGYHVELKIYKEAA